MIISTVLSEKPLIEGNSVTLKICKSGTKAYDSKGKEYILTKEALESSGESWTGGIVTVNHMVKEKGKMTKSWFEDPYVYATFEGLSPETVDAINSKAYRGVSQESEPVKVDGNKVLQLKGTGSTFVFYPFKPACPMKEGCGLPIASCDPDFNFPLYSHTENFDVDTPGGVNITEADQSAKLESTISDLKTENKDLKSTIDELRKELTEKDGKIESTVNAAVKAALESHDKQLKDNAEREAVFTELKSSVSPETLDGLKDAPVSILKSTLAAIKETAGKHVGANSGTVSQSTGDDIDYASLGITSIEVE